MSVFQRPKIIINSYGEIKLKPKGIGFTITEEIGIAFINYKAIDKLQNK